MHRLAVHMNTGNISELQLFPISTDFYAKYAVLLFVDPP